MARRYGGWLDAMRWERREAVEEVRGGVWRERRAWCGGVWGGRWWLRMPSRPMARAHGPTPLIIWGRVRLAA